jgi:hypothetical protein
MCRTARIRRANTPEGFPLPQDPTACLRNCRPRSDFHTTCGSTARSMTSSAN